MHDAFVIYWRVELNGYASMKLAKQCKRGAIACGLVAARRKET